MSEKNYDDVQFSIDPINTIRAWLTDPSLRELVYEAVRLGPATSLTEKLGYSNLGSKENPVWATLFPATDRSKSIGQDGAFFRAKSSKFPVMRLRKQTKSQAAVVGQPEQVVTAAAVQSMPAGIPDLAHLAKLFGVTPAELISRAASFQPQADADVEVSEVRGEELPADIAALLGQ